MKNKILAITISVLIISCGGNAADAKEEKDSITIEEVEETTGIKAETTENVLEQEQVTEPVVISDIADVEESTKEVIQKDESKEKELIEETVEEVIETTEEVKPVIEKIRANHEIWDVLTKKYVSTAGKVNYKGLKTDLSKIKIYLEHLKNTPPTTDWSKNEKLAYWINLYNASTVYLIVTNYPVSSITKINAGKPWDKKFVKSGNKVYTLNDIENKIVRPTFKDPRIHAALNCAAVSCPKLLNGAFLPNNLNAQLNKQVRAWVNDISKNKLTRDKIQISQIFNWYKVDFKEGVIPFINKYNSTNVEVQITAKISYLEYNWDLND